jgi:hypothetical protein
VDRAVRNNREEFRFTNENSLEKPLSANFIKNKGAKKATRKRIQRQAK